MCDIAITGSKNNQGSVAIRKTGYDSDVQAQPTVTTKPAAQIESKLIAKKKSFQMAAFSDVMSGPKIMYARLTNRSLPDHIVQD